MRTSCELVVADLVRYLDLILSNLVPSKLPQRTRVLICRCNCETQPFDTMRISFGAESEALLAAPVLRSVNSILETSTFKSHWKSSKIINSGNMIPIPSQEKVFERPAEIRKRQIIKQTRNSGYASNLQCSFSTGATTKATLHSPGTPRNIS